MEEVILVNENDEQIGLMEKMEAHRQGVLHRAFSVLVFNTKGELLLQRRALHKYHSPGLWTNTCCSHPRNGESLKDAAKRRLQEEMGMSCELEVKGSFIYKTELEGGLTEHEFDYVLTGISNDLPVINLEEVSEFKYMSSEDLKLAMDEHPDSYTFWIREMNNRKLI